MISSALWVSNMVNVSEYARALFELTEELGSTNAVRDELIALGKIFGENPEYTKLLDTPALAKEERLDLIDSAFSSLDGMLVNLLKIMCEARQIYAIDRLICAYLAEYDKSRGIERVSAITATAMTEAQREALRGALEAKTGKTIIIENTVDKSILGGVKLRYMGRQLDGSLKTRLDVFEKKLQDTVL